jgi:hypothetical protein
MYINLSNQKSGEKNYVKLVNLEIHILPYYSIVNIYLYYNKKIYKPQSDIE